MKNISEVVTKKQRPERVIQFGEGGFLRGFVDWMLQKLNESGSWDGSVVIVQPIEKGMCDVLSAQNCVYTHVMRGLENGRPVVRKDIVDCVSRCVKPYENFEEYKALAQNPDFRFIFSNTTEAGIAYVPTDKLTDAPPKSYPAKLTVLLYERYKAGLNGFMIIPCELIEKNGEKLKEIILKYAGLEKALPNGLKRKTPSLILLLTELSQVIREMKKSILIMRITFSIPLRYSTFGL